MTRIPPGGRFVALPPPGSAEAAAQQLRPLQQIRRFAPKPEPATAAEPTVPTPAPAPEAGPAPVAKKGMSTNTKLLLGAGAIAGALLLMRN